MKWYLRIGLLPKGEATAANQAQYDDVHVHRLRLIRALVDVGGLSTDAVRRVLAAIEDPDASVTDALAVAHRATTRSPAAEPTPQSNTLVDDFIAHRGWEVAPDSPTRQELAAVLDAIASFQPPAGTIPAGVTPDIGTAEAVFALIDPYADAVEPLAAAEVANAPDDLHRDQLVERIVAGAILLERALTSLRRMAQENYTIHRYRP